MDDLVEIDLAALVAHPMNCNELVGERYEKLKGHVERTGRYPPIIVRPLKEDGQDVCEEYEILDGHHRVQVLRDLDERVALCVVWEVDDDEAMMLLATLNRLVGEDDVKKRGELLAILRERSDGNLDVFAKLVPEGRERLEKLLDVARGEVKVRASRAAADLPVSVHFFLKQEEKALLDKRLNEIGGAREEALMKLVVCGDD
ncbi:ParB N-terminal domain-containing protein [Poriferisphaera sp. WC338]|uniref:ParB N-terminal domain-containing protein n=1 Tax=Poriferisphaera sp. WC338 TaxID=3425129 RepID=UPI003D8135E0